MRRIGGVLLVVDLGLLALLLEPLHTSLHCLDVGSHCGELLFAQTQVDAQHTLALHHCLEEVVLLDQLDTQLPRHLLAVVQLAHQLAQVIHPRVEVAIAARDGNVARDRRLRNHVVGPAAVARDGLQLQLLGVDALGRRHHLHGLTAHGVPLTDLAARHLDTLHTFISTESATL